MLDRVLETEAMDTPEAAIGYDAMDHSGVNRKFVEDLLAEREGIRGGVVLDVGTGPGRIALLLAEADPECRVVGLDMAWHMIRLARELAAAQGVADRVVFEQGDAKRLPFEDGRFDVVMSNSIIHHIPEPGFVVAEMKRVLKPGGLLFCRDLARPGDRAELDRLVATYAGTEAAEAQAMFAASLHAALTVPEFARLTQAGGAACGAVEMSSDRHWTWIWRKPLAERALEPGDGGNAGL
jgi:ubiquinone/menaquinone biosynthesis C-methylase UbiE